MGETDRQPNMSRSRSELSCICRSSPAIRWKRDEKLQKQKLDACSIILFIVFELSTECTLLSLSHKHTHSLSFARSLDVLPPSEKDKGESKETSNQSKQLHWYLDAQVDRSEVFPRRSKNKVEDLCY
jgi:hypothetical protein